MPPISPNRSISWHLQVGPTAISCYMCNNPRPPNGMPQQELGEKAWRPLNVSSFYFQFDYEQLYVSAAACT